ncbi:MAG: hypothetical protein ACLFO1_05750 [Spirochaetaceae bacterium]
MDSEPNRVEVVRAALRFHLFLIVTLAAVVLMAVGCATAPERRDVPQWVVEGPETSEEYVFFVGSGTSETNSVVDAEERATLAVVDEIVRYLGARIEVETTAEVQASLDSFEEQVTRQLRQTSEARLSGLRVIDKYVDEGESRVTVYTLIRYDRDALEAERQRLRDLVQERDDSVAVPEREALEAAAEGNLFAAIGHHVEAAVAAMDSRIDNGELRMRRNLSDALAAARRITIDPARNIVEVYVSEDSAEPFMATVRTQPAGEPVPDARVVFTFPERTGGGRTVVRSRTVSVNADGEARFVPPPPSAVGRSTVTITLATRELLEPLDSIRDVAPEEVTALRSALQDVRASMQYEVLSQAREVSTGIVVLDTDIAGNPVDSDSTATGLLQALSQDGFSVQILPYDATNLVNGNRQDVVTDLEERYGNEVSRVILGVGRIEEFDESNGFLVTVSGSVTAYELSTGRTLYATEEFQRSRGSSSSGAIAAAFRSLGAKIGETLAVNLP